MKQSEEFCPVIKDLCTLYKRQEVSSDTRKVIEEHLNTCPSCRDFYRKESAQLSVSSKEETARYAGVARRIRRRRRILALCVVFLVVTCSFLTLQMYQSIFISGSCMEPSMHDGDGYLLNKWKYRLNAPNRYDIAVYEQSGTYYTSRIYGLPGEKIEIKEGRLLINDSPIETFSNIPDSYSLQAFELSDREYFFITDNFRNSEYGCQQVDKKDIIGKISITQ